jgi:hypothetical protein
MVRKLRGYNTIPELQGYKVTRLQGYKVTAGIGAELVAP